MPTLPASLVDLDATALAQAIRERSASCAEVMEAYLGQIDRYNPAVNAIVALEPRERLMAEARRADADLAAGRVRGPLHGLPWAVKDLAHTRGIRTTYGSPLFKDFVPEEDGVAVSRLRAAGAIFIGKTNVPEFGLGSQTYNPVYGTTGNAHDPGKTSGGSSGGAAVALALRMLPAADGSDMMGSLRNPAAFNNVLGFRPSFGRVPFGPSEDVFFAQLAYEGPMGRSVRDVALLLSVQAGYDSRSPLSLREDPADFARPAPRDVKGTRIGWLGDFGGYLAMEPGVLDVCQASLRAFESLGCTVEAVDIRYPLEKVWDAWVKLRHTWVGGRKLAAYRDPAQHAQMKPELIWEIEGALGLSALDIYQASVARSSWYAHLSTLFARYDVLLAPTVQVFPFDKEVHWPATVGGRTMDTYHRWMESTSIWSITGLPAMAIPSGFGSHGLPTGVQIIGPNHADLTVLQLAAAYEAAMPLVAQARPPMLGAQRVTP
ncbi:amidase [Chelatococcus reniformis]|uniref:Amidase n=1 Tax=Chelatococcus reniformis TaxID=1494448 RepID=A0A916UBY7_9HYPH|nr:amidase [Chelatococcus reniformis]GGC68088.1 amidase [Chelatococcus reniformis]